MNVAMLLLALVSIAGSIASSESNAFENITLETIQSWKKLEYAFPSEEYRKMALRKGNLVEGAGTLIDVGVDYRDDGSRRLFVTVPRLTRGIPFSLGVVSSKRGVDGSLIEAYPNYSHKSHGNHCKGITSAFRVAIDECRKMWVIDSGQIAGEQLCPPQLLVFNLSNDKLIHRYKFPANIYIPRASLFISPIVDVRDPPPAGRCAKTMVYIPDVHYHGLVVYDLEKNSGWRVENKLMYPNPDFATHTIAGESFDLMDGIFGLSVDPPRALGERKLYFHALASDSENAVPLRLLDNESIWSKSPNARSYAFTRIGKRGVECTTEAMDSDGFLYCVTMDPIRLIAWNTRTRYTNESYQILSNDVETLQFASGLKIVRNRLGKEEIWISTCRFQKISAGTQNANEINFRILARDLDDLWNAVRSAE